MRLSALALAVALVACGRDGPPPPADPGVSVAAVASEGGDGSRLSPVQLAAFLPERVGAFEPIAESFRAEEVPHVREASQVSSAVWLRYKSPLNRSLGSGAWDVEVKLQDARDAPATARSAVSDLESAGLGESETWDGHRQFVERTGDDWARERHDGTFGSVERTVWFDGQIEATVMVRREPDSGLTLADLAQTAREVTGSPPVARLGDAPTGVEAPPTDGPPAWLGGEAAAPTLAFTSCDAALPIAEVERACGAAGLRAVDTGMVPATDCNRVYTPGDATTGLIFLLSQYDQAATARRGLAVASDTERSGETRPLPGLADGGYSFVSGVGEPRVAFVAGTALVELKGGAGLCARREQVEAVARSVAARLTE